MTADKPAGSRREPEEQRRGNPHSGHRERLKRRCLEEGLDGFDEHQVLELTLFYALPYRDTNELAHRLLDSFGSFGGVLDAEYHDLLRVEGVGANTALLLTMLPELFRRYQLDKLQERPLLSSKKAAGDFVTSLFIGSKRESFYVISLDAKRQVIRAAMIGEGTVGCVSVYPRLAVETALRYGAHSVLLAHNHPAGTPQPSADDLNLTDSLVNAMHSIGIPVLDHLIVCGSRFVSFADMGLLRGW